MRKADAEDIAEIRRIVSPWLGSVAWKAEIVWGSILPVEFGAEMVIKHRSIQSSSHRQRLAVSNLVFQNATAKVEP